MRKTGLFLAVALICAVPFLLGGDSPDADRESGCSTSAEAADDATSAAAVPFRSSNWKQAAPVPKKGTEDYSPLDDYARKEAAERAEALDKKRRATARRLSGTEIAFTKPPTPPKKDTKR